jgi:hypothetical protein
MALGPGDLETGASKMADVIQFDFKKGILRCAQS